MEPCKESFDFPSSSITPKLPAVLCRLCFPAPHPVGSDDFNTTMPFQASVQRVAVVGFIANQPLGKSPCKAVMEGFIDKGHFMWRSTSNPYGDRKAMAVRNCHDLGPFASLCWTNATAPLFALAKVPSMKASLRSIPPRDSISATRALRADSNVLPTTHSPNRLWQVWYGGNSGGKSFHLAPVRNTQRIPSITSRLPRRGLPLRPDPLLPSGNRGAITSHCSSVNSIRNLLFREWVPPKLFTSLLKVQNYF